MTDAEPPPPSPIKPVSAVWLWIAYAGFVLMGFILLFVIPRFIAFFKSVNVDLPAATMFFVSIAQFLGGLGPLAFVPFVGAGFFVYYLQDKVTSRLLVFLLIAATWAANVAIAATMYLPFMTLVRSP